MSYALPEEGFNPLEWAKNKTKRASQTREALIQQFISGYEDFWGVNNNTSMHTVEEMQSIIDAMPAALDILADAVKFATFANQAFPGQLPEKYYTGVFAVTVSGSGDITLGELNPAWVPVVPETPAPTEPDPE